MNGKATEQTKAPLESRSAAFLADAAFSRDLAGVAAGLFRVLGDPSRVLVILALEAAGELCVSDLSSAVGMSAPAVSHHLRILRYLGFVSSCRQGRFVYYRLEQDRLREQVASSCTQIDHVQRNVPHVDRPIRIGSTLPLTGFAAPDGLEQLRAITLAVEEWNARGGIQGRPIEHVFLDVTDMTPSRMVPAFRSLIHDHRADAIVNGYLLFTGAEHDLVAESSTPYIHSNTSSVNQGIYSKDPDRHWMCFQCDPSEKLYAYGFVHFLRFLDRTKAFQPQRKRIAIISGSDPYSETIASKLDQVMKKVGWTVCVFEDVEAPCRAWDPILSRIRKEQPDVIFLSDIVLEDNVTFVKAFLENPVRALVYGPYAPTLQEYVSSLGAEAEGTITSTVGGVLPGPLGDLYQSTYERRWGVAPGASIGGLLYDETNLYLTAVALAGGPEDRRKVCDLLKGLWVRGTTGVCHFTRDRVVPSYPVETSDPASGMPHLFFQVQGGQQRILFPGPYVQTHFIVPPWF